MSIVFDFNDIGKRYKEREDPWIPVSKIEEKESNMSEVLVENNNSMVIPKIISGPISTITFTYSYLDKENYS